MRLMRATTWKWRLPLTLTGGSLAAATDAQAIIVLGSSGEVYYNADGATAGGLVRLATLSTVGSVDDIAATDFVLV